MCREKPQQILHYHGKKAKEMYSRLKEVYDDPGIPPEGRKASYTDRITVRKH